MHDLDGHLTEVMVVKLNEVESLYEERIFWKSVLGYTVKGFISEKTINNAMGPCNNILVPISSPPSWIKLPSQRTLHDYTYYTKTKAGFGDDIDQQLMETAQILTCPHREKYVILIMDEMHIKEDIV